MVLNPFFQQGSTNEQNLVQSLINEQLQIYGVNVHYMPRKYANSNTIIKEVIESKFDDAYPIEAYVESFDGYGENPTLLSKFGIQATNELTLTISRDRFETYISPLMKNESDVRLSTRPKEGDLVYFPLGDRLFEIKYVEHEQPFYQQRKIMFLHFVVNSSSMRMRLLILVLMRLMIHSQQQKVQMVKISLLVEHKY